tara:strand:- start:916 stop:1119 length:204 start_codon:yes stop_codon:yes gene_type:complete
MDRQKAEDLAENLKGLACKECTKGWLENHDGLTDPIQDITNCAFFELISPALKDRLINEVIEIKAEI